MDPKKKHNNLIQSHVGNMGCDHKWPDLTVTLVYSSFFNYFQKMFMQERLLGDDQIMSPASPNPDSKGRSGKIKIKKFRYLLVLLSIIKH